MMLCAWLCASSCVVISTSTGGAAVHIHQHNTPFLATSAATPTTPTEAPQSTPSSFTTTATITTATTTTTTATFTTTAFAGCGGVIRCLDDEQCAQCLSSINATTGCPHTEVELSHLSVAALREYNVGFFQALQSTASCSVNVTSPGCLHPALQELGNVASCIDTYGMVMSDCRFTEYGCFADSNCRECLAALYAADGTGTQANAAGSLACSATNPTLLFFLQSYCGGGSFPVCTFQKEQCASSPECSSCLELLGSGDGAGAARQCRGTRPAALTMDNVVSKCATGDAVGCDFWRQRCSDNAHCAGCIAGMSNGDNARAIAAD